MPPTTTATTPARKQQIMSTIKPPSLPIDLRVLVVLVVAAIVSYPVLARNPSNHHQQHDDSDKIQAATQVVAPNYSVDHGEAHKHAQRDNSHNYMASQRAAARGMADEFELGTMRAPTTRTFERVVLEGTRVSISCPHSSATITVPRQQPRQQQRQEEEEPDGHQQRSRLALKDDDDEQKQFAPTGEAKLLNNINNRGLQTTQAEGGQIEQVRWFRNHVPLLGNSNNHFPHWRQQHNSQLDPVGWGGGAVDALELESNWTTKLSTRPTQQGTLISGSDSSSSSSSSASDDEKEQLQQRQPSQLEQKLANQFQGTSDYGSSSGSGSQSQDLGSQTSGSGNVNELVGNFRLAESRALAREEPQWYTNKFGELVINKVSLYFAGKYTCLVAGQQSEVLLDVLVDTKQQVGGGHDDESQPEESQQALKEEDGMWERVPGPRQGADARVLASEGISGSYGDEFSRDFRPHVDDDDNDNDNGDELENGNPIEKQEDETATLDRTVFSDATCVSSAAATAAPPTNTNTNSFKLELETNDNDSEPEDNNSPAGKSNSSPAEAASVGHINSIKLELGTRNYTTNNSPDTDNNRLANLDTTRDRLWLLAREEGKILAGPDLGGLKERSDDADQNLRAPEVARKKPWPPPVAEFETSGSSNIHRPEATAATTQAAVHLVKSEAIQMNDLKLVPGFLYTKQQFYCPIAGLTQLHFDHIYPIIHELCSSSSAPKTGSSSISELPLLRCHLKAEHLIRLIVGGDAAGGSVSLVDLVWLKDGKQLEFDKNGRATNTNMKNVNLKLIHEEEHPSGGCGANLPANRPTGLRPVQSSAMGVSKYNNNDKFICPPGGRTLEIDGIRRESGGRYTCALRLSIRKFQNVLQNLAGLNEPDEPIKWRDNSIYNNNNILSATTSYSAKESNLEQQQHANGGSDGTGRNTYDRRRRHYGPGAPTSLEEPEEETGANQLLDSILNGTISSEMSLNYLANVSSRVQSRLKTIQSFSLVVAERAANSCDLWSTILEAGNAYTRRKLADFKRLKRSNGLDKDSFSGGGSDIDKDDNDHGDGFAATQWRHHNKQPQDGRRPQHQHQQTMKLDPEDSKSMDANQLNNVANLATGSCSSCTASPMNSNDAEFGSQQGDNNEANLNVRGARGPDGPVMAPNNHDEPKWPAKQEQEVEAEAEGEGPLYGWRQISASLDGAGGGDKGTLLNNSDRSADIASIISANNYNDDNIAAGTGTNRRITGQTTMIHKPEAGPFNYANERSPEPLYASATAATNEASPIVASSGHPINPPPNHATLPLLPGRRTKRSPMIKGGGEFHDGGDNSANSDKPETKDLIMQRGRRRGINSGASQGPSYAQVSPAEGGSRRPEQTVIDGTYMAGQSTEAAHVIDDKARSMGYHVKRSNPLEAVQQQQRRPSENRLLPGDVADRNQQQRTTGSDEESDKRQRSPEASLDAHKEKEKHLGDKLLLLPSGGHRIRHKRSSSSSSGSGSSTDASPNRMQAASQLNIQTNTQSSYPPHTLTPVGTFRPQTNPLSQPPGPPGSPLAHYRDHGARGVSLGLDHQSAGDSSSSSSSVSGAGDVSSIDSARSPGRADYIDGQQQSGGIANSFTKPMAYEDGFDESLMWTAGQYLYMHMRAVASSSMFGVEVAVEWSNERSNGTNIDIDMGADRNLNSPDYGTKVAAKSNGGYLGLSDGAVVRDVVPFATIDVISGQNLQLQCTAQALGRLPEVKWYKRINAIPNQLGGLTKMTRRIGHDLYWPLTELDILNEYERFPKGGAGGGKSFVCSQTTAIFDNLANQTFTVISSLKLSQYNDFTAKKGDLPGDALPDMPLDPTGSSGSSRMDGKSYNLYACIVDADVRHNYATLGVHFREAPSNKISFEMSKRLGARFAMANKKNSRRRTRTRRKKEEAAKKKRKEVPVVEKEQPPGNHAGQPDKYTNFDLYRQNQLQFPLKPSYWIPIQNGSSYMIDAPLDGSPLTPVMLSTVIVFVFGSLVGLMYLTLRTYRNLTLNQLDEELISQFDDDDRAHDQGAATTTGMAGVELRRDIIGTSQDKRMGSNFITLDTRCACHPFNEQTIGLRAQQPEVEAPEVFGNSYLDEIAAQLGLEDAEFVANAGGGLYYRAHTNEPHECACHSSTDNKLIPIITVLPSEPNKQSASYSNIQHQQPVKADCCQSSSPISMAGPCQQPTSGRSSIKVNLVENPLS